MYLVLRCHDYKGLERITVLDIAHINEMIAPDIAVLEKELARVLGDEHPFLRDLGARILAAPGKRLRPRLLILCAHMLGYQGDKAPLFGLVFELVHTATLVHDDIIDGAETRRGRYTLNHDLGNTLTVLYGDLLYTKAHSTAIEAGSLELMEVVTRVSERMIEGELLQHRHHFDIELTEAQYFDILERKTAHLFGGTTRSAGLLTGCSADECQALEEFGYEFGISFQLMDDYLDYTGAAEVMGKPVLSDLLEGKMTLPVLRMMAEDDGSLKQQIKELWDGNQDLLPQLGETIRNHHALKDTRELARHHAERASRRLVGFAENKYREILRNLPLYLIDRVK